jgi:hypothetical protein
MEMLLNGVVKSRKVDLDALFSFPIPQRLRILTQAAIPVCWQGLTGSRRFGSGDSGPDYASDVFGPGSKDNVESCVCENRQKCPGQDFFIVLGQCVFVSGAQFWLKQLSDVNW